MDRRLRAEDPSVATDTSTGVSCPQCGALCPSDPRYVTWCDQCDWNVRPAGAVPAPRRADRWMESSVQAEHARGTRVSGYLIATYLYATVVYPSCSR